MGRNKLEIKRLEKVGRQITFSKRRMGITKKARELSILCDVDVLLVIFSTSGKPMLCLGEKSTFEGVIYRYAEQSAQARNKRKFETLVALKKTFKNANHVVNIDQLKDPESYLLEEVKRQLLTCRDEITETLSFLGPLAEYDRIDEIEDANKIIAMEHKINDLLTQNRVRKENAKNYAKYVMNKPYQLKEQQGSFLYTGPDGLKIKNRRDLAEYNTGYETPVSYPTQDITWVQVDKNQHTVIDELPGLRHLPIETPLCMESIKMDEIQIAKTKGSGNCNGNQNQFMCQGQEDTFTMNVAPFEAGSLHLQEMSGNDFVDDFWLEEENVNNHAWSHQA